MQKFFIEGAFKNITGKVEGEFVNDKGVYGSATISLYGKNRVSPQWRYIDQQAIYPVNTNALFSFCLL